MRRSAILIAIGGLLAYGGFLAVLAAIVLGLIAIGLSYWLAALVSGIALAVVGYILIYSGSAGLRARTLTPRHTVETLKEDAQWLKGQAQ